MKDEKCALHVSQGATFDPRGWRISPRGSGAANRLATSASTALLPVFLAVQGENIQLLLMCVRKTNSYLMYVKALAAPPPHPGWGGGGGGLSVCPVPPCEDLPDLRLCGQTEAGRGASRWNPQREKAAREHQPGCSSNIKLVSKDLILYHGITKSRTEVPWSYFPPRC